MGVIETIIKETGLNSTNVISYSLIVCILTPIIAWILQRQKKARMIEKIPGPKALPVLGNALEFNVGPRELFQKFLECCTYGQSISRVWLTFQPYVLIYEAKAAEIILSSNKHIDKSHDYVFLHPWLGTGLLTSTGRKWHGRRKMLTPTFHFKILEDFIEVFNKHSNTFCQKIEEKQGKGNFNIFPMCTLVTLDVILETAMGVNLDVQNNEESEYVEAVTELAKLVQHRQARPWFHPDVVYTLSGLKKKQDHLLSVLHGFTDRTIESRKKEFYEAKKNKKLNSNKDDIGTKKRLAFLDLLIEYNDNNLDNPLTHKDIREEVDTFMFEGHDTTAASINWVIYCLGSYPEIQARVHEEIDRIFGDSDRPVNSSDLRELKYLENCIKEALRLFPSVPFLGRELTEEVVIDGYKIPIGTTIVIVVYQLHRDPEQFPDPEVFNPDRFNLENSYKRHNYSYVPFSAGPRNCIGQKFALMEEKVVLCNILRKYRFETDVKREDLKILGELILRPEDGTQVRAFRR